MVRNRAESRRLATCKVKLYQALYDCQDETLSKVENDIKFFLEADTDVVAAIRLAERKARNSRERRRKSDGE